MSLILLVAPGVVPPWTEGRKNFVRDLARALPGAGREIEIIDGASLGADSFGSRLLAPWRAYAALRRRLREKPSDTAVALFPYGRFSGYVGAMNRAFLRAARRACRVAGVAHATVFYSAAGLGLDALGSYAPALAVGRAAPSVHPMHLGIAHDDCAWRRERSAPKRVLFLCGYQNPTPSVLQAVMDERGLRDLLSAGQTLADLGMRLTIAIPFLRDAQMRALLAAEAARLSPELHVDLDGETRPLDALLAHDVFVFPYRAEHAVFVPTSLLEAFSVGVPVVAADHAMYGALTRDGEMRCALHRAGDPADLARAVTELAKDFDAAIGRAERARAYVRSEWTIDRCVGELLAALAGERASAWPLTPG